MADSCVEELSRDQTPRDERIRAVCVDVIKQNDGVFIAECYSLETRRIYNIRVPDGRVNKTWQLTFVIRETDEDGISEVEDYEILEEPSVESRSVLMRRDGIVTLKSYVAISYCPHHESYDGKIFWSEEFGRVLAGEDDQAQRLVIYSTFVKRDKSDLAKLLGVDFRICELLKEVTDETVRDRCTKRMMEEQQALYEEAHPSSSHTPQQRCSDIGQSTFNDTTFNANFFAFREGKPRGNGLFVGLKMPKPLRGSERCRKMSEYKKQESDNCLLLFTKKKKRFSEAWCRSLGRVMVLNTVFNGNELKVGDWFHASVRLFPELFKNIEPIYATKRIIDLAEPLADTDCFLDRIQIQVECTGEYVKNEHIFDHTLFGNVEMTVEQSEEVRAHRMLCLLRFNHDNPYHRPWHLVKFIRELSEQEPMLSREWHINDRDLIEEPSHSGNPHLGGYRQRDYDSDDGAQTGRDSYSGYRRRARSSSSVCYRHPLLEEAFDIVDRLLYEPEVYETIERTYPWLLNRMKYFMTLREEDGSRLRSGKNSYYEPPSNASSRQEWGDYRYRRSGHEW